MKEYKHLNLVQRSEISALKASGKKQKDIRPFHHQVQFFRLLSDRINL